MSRKRPPDPPADPPTLRLATEDGKPAKPRKSRKAREVSGRVNAKGEPDRQPPANLTDAIREQIVIRLACDESVVTIQEWLTEEHEITLSARAINNYRPTQYAVPMARRWHELYEATRKAFVAETISIPIAHRAYRVRELGELYNKAKKAGDLPVAASFLEQAAKEMGNVFTNVSRSGGMVAHVVGTIEDFTPEERRNMLADRLKDAVARIPALPASQTTIEGTTT